MRAHGHNLTRTFFKRLGRWERHHDNGLFIWVAVRLAIIPKNADPKPPPTSNRIIESSSRTRAPYFLSMNTLAHIMIIKPTIIAQTPVIKKLGIIEIACKAASGHNLCAGPMGFITILLGVTFP